MVVVSAEHEYVCGTCSSRIVPTATDVLVMRSWWSVVHGMRSWCSV